MDDLIALAWRGEEELLTPRVRGNPALLLELLDPGFREIGQSGRLWHRTEIVAALVEDTAGGTAPEAARLGDRAALPLSPDTVLLTYRLLFGGRQSLRSSLWRRSGKSARCLFHQGTPIRPPAP
ncbi:DUF4440 domain-containing protein [Paeniglutamicibacter sp. R2-26]|uniref:nuclear transport factor 2 family protein n=1 Tax=Paeniglutamicibacter sp. R2-26 TaxID=3144417 RepID=UPI003EE45B2F